MTAGAGRGGGLSGNAPTRSVLPRDRATAVVTATLPAVFAPGSSQPAAGERDELTRNVWRKADSVTTVSSRARVPWAVSSPCRHIVTQPVFPPSGRHNGRHPPSPVVPKLW